MQDDSGVGDIIDGKEWEGGRLSRNHVGACHDGERGVVEQAGSGLLHAGGFTLQIKDGKMLARDNKWSVKWSLRKWKVIVVVEPLGAEGAVGGIPRICRVINRGVRVRIEQPRRDAMRRRAAHGSMRRLSWFVGVHEHNVHGQEGWSRDGAETLKRTNTRAGHE